METDATDFSGKFGLINHADSRVVLRVIFFKGYGEIFSEGILFFKGGQS